MMLESPVCMFRQKSKMPFSSRTIAFTAVAIPFHAAVRTAFTLFIAAVIPAFRLLSAVTSPVFTAAIAEVIPALRLFQMPITFDFAEFKAFGIVCVKNPEIVVTKLCAVLFTAAKAFSTQLWNALL